MYTGYWELQHEHLPKSSWRADTSLYHLPGIIYEEDWIKLLYFCILWGLFCSPPTSDYFFKNGSTLVSSALSQFPHISFQTEIPFSDKMCSTFYSKVSWMPPPSQPRVRRRTGSCRHVPWDRVTSQVECKTHVGWLIVLKKTCGGINAQIIQELLQ